MTAPVDSKNLPNVFVERLERIVPRQSFKSVLASFSAAKETAFRINSLKGDCETIARNLAAQGFSVKPMWIPNAFILKSKTLGELQKTDSYKNGEIYVQNPSSMIPAAILDPKPGETVLDLTAAPGSKTTQIAGLMRNEGRLVANDNNRGRFFKLKAVVELMGATAVELSLRYGESFGRKFPEMFDRILLDAPCSAEGRFHTGEPKTYRYWSARKIKEMQRKQKKLFYSAFHALRPGGTMVYSTCTFAPEENEEIIDWALKKLNDQLEIDSIHIPDCSSQTGIVDWKEKGYDSRVRNALRVLPDTRMEAFFIARAHKKSAA